MIHDAFSCVKQVNNQLQYVGILLYVMTPPPKVWLKDGNAAPYLKILTQFDFYKVSSDSLFIVAVHLMYRYYL